MKGSFRTRAGSTVNSKAKLSGGRKKVNENIINVSSGKMKLALINPKGDVSIIAECDTEMSEPIQSTLNVESGNNRIKIVAGENTKFDIEISIQEGEFKELAINIRIAVNYYHSHNQISNTASERIEKSMRSLLL